MRAVVNVPRAVTCAFQPGGIAVRQNNGIPANRKIPHVHFYVAVAHPDGGTEFGDVTELPVSETDRIAERLRPFLPNYSRTHLEGPATATGQRHAGGSDRPLR
jgi:histidine triad (HIT) family protein